MKKTSAPHLSYLSCCLGLAGIMVSSYASAAGLTKLTKEIEDYTPVTQKRLNEANPKDWLLPKGNYEGWMFSELQQINKKNVKKLTPVWTYSTNLDSGQLVAMEQHDFDHWKRGGGV